PATARFQFPRNANSPCAFQRSQYPADPTLTFPPPPSQGKDSHGFRTAASAISEKRAGTAHFGANPRFPSRQAPPGLCDQSEQPGQRLADGKPVAGTDHPGDRQGRVEE